VSRWRARFLESGFRGLEDEPRTGAPRQIPADRRACVLRMALSGRSVNSTRAIALSTGVSQSTVCRVRRQFGIQPGMPGEGDPAVLALFGIHRVRVTGFFATPTGGVLAVDGGDPGGGVLVVCGGEPDIAARLPRPLLRPDGAGDPWTVLHQWLGFFADVRALCRDSRVTGNGSRLLARPA
ncbi:MAG: helix-turn-helix domain-containing protein, partial [Planctomycetota bacterium]